MRLLVAVLAASSLWGAAYTTTQAGNLSAAATWGGSGVPGIGDTCTITKAVTVDVDTTIGTSPVAGTAVVTVTNSPTVGSLTIAPGVTLTVLGDLVLTHAVLTFTADSILEFDPSSAAAPTTTSYRLLYGTGFGSPYATLQSSGTSAAHPYIIRTKPSAVLAGYKAGRVAVGSGAHTVVSLAYGLHTSIGDTTNTAFNWAYNAESGVVASFDHITWDTCGLVVPADTPTATSGWSITNNIFRNTNAITNGGTGKVNPLKLSGSAPTSGTRLIQGNTFDRPPFLIGTGTTYKDNYFDQGWDDALSATAWTEFSGSVIRLIANTGQNVSGSITNSYMLADTWAVSTSVVTGTATSATSTTLVDTAKTWTVNQFLGNATANNWFVEITGGTGVGQIRNITANTATALTLKWAWAITPDGTSTYTIWTGMVNPHMLVPSSSFASSFTGIVIEFTGADANGDCILSSAPAFAITVSTNLSLPNGGGDNPCNGINFGSSADNVLRITAEHNTWFGGNQSPAVDDFTTHTGLIASFKSNLIWTQNSGPAGSLGPYKLMDESHATTGATVMDIVSPANADYNACWNCAAGSYQGNGYALLLSSQAGAHDVNMTGGSGPQFTDSTRNFYTWAKSLGSTGTLPQDYISDGRAKLLSGAYSVADLIAWVKNGFSPQNAALHNAGHDGADIGAVAWQAVSFPAGALSGPIVW